jgi:hypothetical protein
MRTYVLQSFSFTVVEHDPDRPWIVVGSTEHRTVDLPDGVEFYAWAAAEFPRKRFTVELAPWQLSSRIRH